MNVEILHFIFGLSSGCYKAPHGRGETTAQNWCPGTHGYWIPVLDSSSGNIYRRHQVYAFEPCIIAMAT
jgi:hypothetical protein